MTFFEVSISFSGKGQYLTSENRASHCSFTVLHSPLSFHTNNSRYKGHKINTQRRCRFCSYDCMIQTVYCVLLLRIKTYKLLEILYMFVSLLGVQLTETYSRLVYALIWYVRSSKYLVVC